MNDDQSAAIVKALRGIESALGWIIIVLVAIFMGTCTTK